MRVTVFNILKFFVIFFITVAMPTFSVEAIAKKLIIGSFSTGSIEGWKNKEFKGQTDYHIEKIDGIRILKAESKDAGSGLFYEQRIDLRATPFINWRWRIENRMGPLNEQDKSGDDFAARIYAVKSGGLVFWNTRAINYVWSASASKDKSWPNPFAGDHVMMTAVRVASDGIGMWYVEKRNLREDFKRLTGEDIQYIDAVAIMTDTDNAHGHATAYYGDIYFTDE